MCYALFSRSGNAYYVICDIVLKEKDKDNHMSHLRNVSIERKMEVVKGCRRLRDYDTNPMTN